MASITHLLLEPNKLIGTALWESLTLLVDYTTGCIMNQPESTTFEEGKPQAISLLCIDENREDLPGDYHYHYRIECEIDIAKEVKEHVVMLSVTELIAGGKIVYESIYYLKLNRFRNLYGHLLTPDRDKYLSILEPDDFNEWWLDD